MTTNGPSLPNDKVAIQDLSWRRFFRALLNRSPVSGTATFAAASSVVVPLNPPLPDADYNVLLDLPENKTFWTTGKSASGFTLNASSSTSVTVGYTIARL